MLTKRGIGSSGVVSAATVLTVCVFAAGCGGSGQPQAPANRVLDVVEKDFKITAPMRVAPGEISIRARNRGPDDHELIVVRARAGMLPMRKDGITVDEDALEPETAGAIEPFAPHAIEELHVRLRPGRYVLLCNMAGHFLGGMHRTLIVG
jgi:uncharacterized cupredoxin-like copper-binding protein